jgi:CBS domain containing-hemolysin-like protein
MDAAQTLRTTARLVLRAVRPLVSALERAGEDSAASNAAASPSPGDDVLIRNVFAFADTVTREVMIPRPEVVAIGAAASLVEIVRAFQTSGYSRILVCGGDIDDVVGVVHSKDLMPYLLNPDGFRLERILHDPLFVPDNAPLEEVLRLMQRRQSHFAIAVDEHGGVEGILTLEDLLEEIVGDIQDEHDEEAVEGIHREVDGTVLLEGSVSVRELNRRLALALPESDSYTTLAGFLMARAGRLLAQGDEVAFERMRFTVEVLDRRRISRVRMESATDDTDGTDLHG